MATPLVNSQTHDGLERVISAFGALAALFNGAVQHARAASEARRNDARLMEVARHDPRVLADLQAAKMRAESGRNV